MNQGSKTYASVEYPGIILIDTIIQSLFQGIILGQGVTYSQHYGEDPKRERFYVAIVIFLSILQTVLQGYKVWRSTIFNRPWSTSTLQWSDVFLNSVICAFAQAFYIRRCWKITNKRYWIVVPLICMAISILVASIYLAVASQQVMNRLSIDDEDDRAGRYLVPTTIVAFTYWIFGSLALDITVTTILITTLWRSRTGLAQSDKTVWHIITLTWEAAVPPSLFMLVGGSLYHAGEDSNNHIVLLFVLLTGKLYTLGLLRTLNSRVKLRERMKSHDLGRRSLSNWQWGQEPDQGSFVQRSSTADSVSPTSETVIPSIEEHHTGFPVACMLGGMVSRVSFGSLTMDARERGIVRADAPPIS